MGGSRRRGSTGGVRDGLGPAHEDLDDPGRLLPVNHLAGRTALILQVGIAALAVPQGAQGRGEFVAQPHQGAQALARTFELLVQDAPETLGELGRAPTARADLEELAYLVQGEIELAEIGDEGEFLEVRFRVEAAPPRADGR